MSAVKCIAALALVLVTACASPYVQAPGSQSVVPQTNGNPRDGTMTVRVSDGAALPLRVWAPAERGDTALPRAVIVGVHGFNDYSTTFDAPGYWWAERGIVTYAYDQRGFGAAPEPGTWPGQQRLVQDLEDVVAAVADRHPGIPLFVHGNSMGGAVVLLALERRDLGTPLAAIQGASLTAPAVWGGAAMSPVYRASLWIAAHTAPSRHLTGRGLGVLPSDNIDMLRALGRDPLVIKATRIDALYGLVGLMGAAQRSAAGVRGNVLVMYGAKDAIIPRRPTAAMAARMNGESRFAVYPGGYHMLLRGLEAETVWADVLAWIDDPLAPLPSGAEVDGRNLFAEAAAN